MRRSAKTRHLYRELDGLQVHYRESGTPSSTAFLLLHGFPSSSYSFREVLPVLGEHCYAIAPDMPGFGFSDAPPLGEDDYTYDAGHFPLETHAAEAAALLVSFVGDVLENAGVRS